MRCPKGIQKGSGHFSELPLTKNHFYTKVRLTVVQSMYKNKARPQKCWWEKKLVHRSC